MIVFDLPLPPSTNRLHFGKGEDAHRRGNYNTWRKRADQMLLAQGRLKVHCGPCKITITINEKAQGDLDNRCKSTLDYLVHHGIIENDNKRIVRRIELQWGPVEGARVEIDRA